MTTNRITRPRQGRFRRGETFVVVREVRVSSATTLNVGDEITRDDYRAGYLRSLFQRRRIGTKGSAWAEMQLARHAGELSSQEAAETVQEQRLAEAKSAAAARARADKAANVGGPTVDDDLEGSAGEQPEGGVDEAIEDMAG